MPKENKKRRSKRTKTAREERDALEQARSSLWTGALGGLLSCVSVRRDDSYPIGRKDWAYVTQDGCICLNPRREASAGEWTYIIAHCLLHLGLGHFEEKYKEIFFGMQHVTL